MPKKTKELTAMAVAKLKTPGRYAVGGVVGLYLQITSTAARSWLFRFMLAGKSREMGLGSADTLTLSEARAEATECRKLLLAGSDPIEARNTKRVAERLEASKAVIFSDCATRYIEAHRAGWKNEKHANQWRNTLETYAYPVFGSLPVAAVNTALVMQVLDPIWRSKTETASRLRGRIESVLDWATVRAYRQGENPARWRGHLDKLLPKRSKVQKVEHHPALPFADIGSFMKALRKQEGIAAYALEFLILTATRTGEVIGARWEEFDLHVGTWTIPAERMKMEKEHRIPLPPRAVKIVKNLLAIKTTEWVFPGGRIDKPLSNMAMLALLKRMGCGDLTTHGFRSTFRDWVSETTNYPGEAAEMALAHAVEDVEGAYRRGDLFDKRRQMMEAWAEFCNQEEQMAAALAISEKANHSP